MESMQEIGMNDVSISYFYRAEEGQRGDGRWPPQARDTGRGMRSRVEVYWRPPEGAKRPKGCVCGISPEAKGVRTQSRRHLNTVKVETGRGQGAERPARPKLRIDRGGMGGGGSQYTDSKVLLHIDDGCLGGGGEVTRWSTHPDFINCEFSQKRIDTDIFSYCVIEKDSYDFNEVLEINDRGFIIQFIDSANLDFSVLLSIQICRHSFISKTLVDNDNDGLFQFEEELIGTSDDNEDSDGDHRIDGLEVLFYHDNPTKANDDDLAYGLSLKVYCVFECSQSFDKQLEIGFRKACDFLFDASDGTMYFEKIDVYYDDFEPWCHIWIADVEDPDKGDPCWPHATIGGWKIIEQKNNQEVFIVMPKKHDGAYPNDEYEWYRTLIHEVGHSVFGCYDEYQYADGSKRPSGWAERHPPSLMNYNLPFELAPWSHPDDQGELSRPNNVFIDTKQYAKHKESCWETYFRELSKSTGVDYHVIDFDFNHDGVVDTEFPQHYSGDVGPSPYQYGRNILNGEYLMAQYMIYETH